MVLQLQTLKKDIHSLKKADYLKHIQKCTCVHKGAIYVFVVIGFFIVLMWRKFTGQFKVPIKDIKAQLFIFQ